MKIKTAPFLVCRMGIIFIWGIKKVFQQTHQAWLATGLKGQLMLYASCQRWKAKQLAQISNSGCFDGSTYLQWNENPKCNWSNERCFACSFNPKIRFPGISFRSPLRFTLIPSALGLPWAVPRYHTHSAYRSEAGAADTAAVLRTGATVAAKLIRTCVTRKA